MKKLIAHTLPVFFFLFLIAVSVHADSINNNPITIDNPFAHGSSLTELLQTIIDKIVLPIGAVIAVLCFIWTGFLFVMSSGDPGKVKTAKSALINTSIGTAVLLGSWVIAAVIGATIDSIKAK